LSFLLLKKSYCQRIAHIFQCPLYLLLLFPHVANYLMSICRLRFIWYLIFEKMPADCFHYILLEARIMDCPYQCLCAYHYCSHHRSKHSSRHFDTMEPWSHHFTIFNLCKSLTFTLQHCPPGFYPHPKQSSYSCHPCLKS
jgi:hypothetical protein